MTAPLCAGNSALFESTDAGHHLSAARICARCDFIAECRTIRDERDGDRPPMHEGTWAGELWINGQRRIVQHCGCGVLLTRNTWGGRARTQCPDCHNRSSA